MVRDGRSVGVRTVSGEEVSVRHAVLADVDAPQLYRDLLSETPLPTTLRADLARFQWDAGTVKVDWALDSPVPWTAPDARLAGTVHLDGLDHLTRWSADLATRKISARPFMLFGQQSMTDPSRQPPGTETAWAYTHVPRQITHDAGGEISGSGMPMRRRPSWTASKTGWNSSHPVSDLQFGGAVSYSTEARNERCQPE
jgi:phytoene dehydrogenase-like protein